MLEYPHLHAGLNVYHNRLTYRTVVRVFQRWQVPLCHGSRTSWRAHEEVVAQLSCRNLQNIVALKLLGLGGGGTITLFANRNRKEVLNMNPQTLAYLAMAAIYIHLAFAH